MRTTTIATVATVVLALLIVAKTRTVGLTEATGNPVQNTMSIYDLDVGHPYMKNLSVQEIRCLNDGAENIARLCPLT